MFIILSIFFLSCKSESQPKPKAFLALQYQKTNYKAITKNLPYQFEIANSAELKVQANYWSDVNYPDLKASINLTYYPIKNNIEKLISDAEKRTFNHTIKADNIEVFPFDNAKEKVYARLFEVFGNAASTIQFQATDSTNIS